MLYYIKSLVIVYYKFKMLFKNKFQGNNWYIPFGLVKARQKRIRGESASDITIPHKICHPHTEPLGNPMEGAESYVPLAALNCAVIRAVHSD